MVSSDVSITFILISNRFVPICCIQIIHILILEYTNKKLTVFIVLIFKNYFLAVESSMLENLIINLLRKYFQGNSIAVC